MTFNSYIILASVLFWCTSAWQAGDLERYGPFQSVLYSDIITCNHNRSLNIDVSQVQVFFYDFANNFNLTFPIHEAADGFNKTYALDVTKRLIIFVPGYKSHISKTNEEKMRRTFQDFPNSYLIILDHSAYTSKKGGKIKSYERSVIYVHYIGKALAEMLAGLKRNGFPSNKIHCIGHSLGAQMLAHTGEIYRNTTGEVISRITGLDPAGPCFTNTLISEQLRAGVADYVEVFHCNAGGLGTTSVLADIDFFFNKEGAIQPHCGTPLIPGFGSSDAAKCNHRACIDYWILTVKQPQWYLAWSCDSYKSFHKGKCAPNEVTIAGFWNPGNATGTFYVSTAGYGVD